MAPTFDVIEGGPQLPPGFHRPTRGLVEEYVKFREVLAEPYAPQITNASVPLPSGRLSRAVETNIEMLEHAVGHEGFLGGVVGLAYPQLAVATPSYRVFVAMLGLSSLRREDLHKARPVTFRNPVMRHLPEYGKSINYEICCSVPGVACVVECWNAVEIRADGFEPRVYHGDDARVIQHENAHLFGFTNAWVARSQGRPCFYVPPELKPAFREAYLKNGAKGWPLMSDEQLSAMFTASYRLQDFVPYL